MDQTNQGQLSIIDVSPSSWVAVPEELNTPQQVEILKSRLGNVQTWFFDLDDNHCKSPSKKIAYRALGTAKSPLGFLGWGLKTGYQLATQGKACESERWNVYVDSFLDDPKTRARLSTIFTPEYALSTIFPGVKDFVDLFPDADKHYVTRTLQEIAQGYATALGVPHIHERSYDKGVVFEQYQRDHPEVQRFGVDGDSEEDADLVKRIKFYDKEVTGIYSMKSAKSQFNDQFDVGTSKDRSALVALLSQ